MNTARDKAKRFLEREQAFRLGMLPTESSHPKTASLSQTIAASTADGIRMLMRVDEEIAPAIERVVASEPFGRLVDALVEAVTNGKRVFFTGCGATGRLAILLEAAWRAFWQDLHAKRPDWCSCFPHAEGATRSVMAGGDYALIRSVEGFEDSRDLGEYQLARAGVASGDVVVAVTEGGETSFVIGTAWQGLAAGARAFFVYNNPSEVLRQHVERSRQVIDEPRIVKLDLYTGPMAVAGSTRMQATTAELLALGAAVEAALCEVLRRRLTDDEMRQLGIAPRSPADYPRLFGRLLDELSRQENVATIARLVEWEEAIYRRNGLVTYMTDRYLLDVLTDTTERAPTFRLPPFRKCDDEVSARSWAFVKNPRYPAKEAWRRLLRREPRGIDWPASVYRSLDVAPHLRDAPPTLDNREIEKFAIGNEIDPSRFEADDAGLAMILVGDEIGQAGPPREAFDRVFVEHAASFARTAAVAVGPAPPDRPVDDVFHVACDLPASPFALWDRLAVKLTLNLMSTATMARMGRVEGNYMSRVETSNKKLVDRATRLVAHLAGVDYETACYALHEAIEKVAPQERATKDAPSPVTVAVEQLRRQRGATADP